jgi:hypothetical protein
MKILFNFECNILPIRANTLINWLVSRGRTVDILYDIVCGELIKGSHYLKKQLSTIQLIILMNMMFGSPI